MLLDSAFRAILSRANALYLSEISKRYFKYLLVTHEVDNSDHNVIMCIMAAAKEAMTSYIYI